MSGPTLVGDEPAHGQPAPTARPAPGRHAALVRGEAVLEERVEAVLDAVPAREREARPEALARAQRQRRRWATQVVVVDELARRACAERGLAPPPEVSPARVLAVSGTEVADLGSIVAVALAHSPAVRALLAALEAEQQVPERAARAYYDRNPDRFLTPRRCGAVSTRTEWPVPGTSCRTRRSGTKWCGSCGGRWAGRPSSTGWTGPAPRWSTRPGTSTRATRRTRTTSTGTEHAGNHTEPKSNTASH